MRLALDRALTLGYCSLMRFRMRPVATCFFTSPASGLAILALLIGLTACSGTIGKLRESSRDAAVDRVSAWQGRKSGKKAEKKLAKTQKEARKAQTKADREWESRQRQTSEEIRAKDREFLKEQQTAAQEKPMGTPAVDVATTEDFQTFLRMVRDAVRARDAETLAPLMTPNFGYNLEPLMEGPGVFEFWESQDLWTELELILGENFVASGGYMVAPAEFARSPETYAGYRAGIAKTPGGWRFAYFVRGP